MDLKFNHSRKYISITVPPKTQTMSPHIKSIDDIVVLGINLSRFNKLTQFFICVAGVFVFYLIYGYLQELIFSMEGFKSYGWYLTLVQFAFYSIFGLIELQLIQDKRRRIPGKTYMIIAFLTVGTMGLSNTSLGYLNYPTQVIFKCCKLIPVMLGGVFIQGKRYNIADVSAAVCMSLGLIWFTLADSTIAPNFNLTGVILISLALCADAVIGNVQEKAMKLHNASNSEMSKMEGGKGREGERILSRLHSQHRARHGAQSHSPEIMTSAKIKRQTFNRLSHPDFNRLSHPDNPN